MILTRSVDFTVNMGPGTYESCKLGASVTLDSDVLGLTEDQVIERAQELLEDAIAHDLKEAQDLTQMKDSFVLSWKAQ